MAAMFVLAKAKQGERRMEFYSQHKQEPFGLHRRTRRIARGLLTSRPDGSYDSKLVELLPRKY